MSDFFDKKFKTEVSIAGVTLKNPVMPASGTFAYGKETASFIDLNKLGAIVVKGISNIPWSGNSPPRIAETPSGMLNSIGLQNPGVKFFLQEDLPFLKTFDTKIIVNICGHSLEDYLEVTEILSDADIDLLELNISCPNIKEGGMTFCANTTIVENIVTKVKRIAKQPLIVKLSPNVSDITEIAKAAESAGADAISLINTLLGMRIDIHSYKPILANVMGGLSGPAIKPIAVRMVYQVAQAIKLPVIGMGGIMTSDDAIEFLLAGATAIAVGTANFYNPTCMLEIIEGLKNYLLSKHINDISKLRIGGR